jgi:hypothetical protein
VGCDGGQSTVRKALGIRYEGVGSEEDAFMSGRMLSFYMRSPALAQLVHRRRAWQAYTMAPSARCGFVALDGKGDYAGLSRLPPGADERSHDPTPLVRAAIGADVPIEMISIKPWTAGLALVAEHYQAGRVLMAGDAVHLFTPTGGFGMNTGIDDVANLAWKLAAVHQGWGGPRLVETYEPERRPIGKRNTECSKMFQRMVAKLAIRPELEEQSADGAAARRDLGAHLATFTEEFASLGIQLGARYENSPLVVADGTVPPPDDPFLYRASAVPGGRAPHVWLRDGSALMDHFGSGFTLLRIGARAPDAGPLRAAAARRGLPLTVLEIDEPDVVRCYERPLVLVRPDHHVAWRGARAPDQPDVVLDAIAGFAAVRAATSAS